MNSSINSAVSGIGRVASTGVMGMGVLDGKVAIVTGGSRGIGAEIARRFGAAGAAVVVSARTTEPGMSPLELARMEAALRARQAGAQGAGRASAERALSECYAELEIGADASDQEVTKAYRRQMSRHHPDKLVARGLPESMAQWAKEKTQRIQEAYEAVRAARGMR